MSEIFTGFPLGLVLGAGIGCYYACKFLAGEREKFDRKIAQVHKVMVELYKANGWPLPDDEEE